MNWKQKTIVRILLIIAKMLTTENEFKVELQSLSNHIGASREDEK